MPSGRRVVAHQGFVVGPDDQALAKLGSDRAGRAEKAADLKRERADQAEIRLQQALCQAEADAAEARAQRTEDRRAELRDRLDAAQTEFVTAGQAAEQARR